MKTSSKKDIYILGIYNGHNCTASLLKNGEIISCVSEERFSGIKNDFGYPKQAIDYVLKTGGISSKDLDFAAIPFKYGTPIHVSSDVKKNIGINFLIIINKPVNLVRYIWGELTYMVPSIRFLGQFIYKIMTIIIGNYTMKKERDFMSKRLSINIEKVKSYDHHLCHAAAGYCASPFNNKKALVLTLDGEGDNFSASVNIFDKDKIQTISKTAREDSLGYIYHDLTKFMGMKANEHEYKVMGLAPYAKLEYVDRIWDKVDKIVKVNKEKLTFKCNFNTVDTNKYLKKEMSNVRFDILAGLFQKLIEEKVTLWVQEAMKKTNINTVVLSGGVFMNVKLNQKIANLPEIKEIFILPSCGDESTVLGSSYLAYRDYCLSQNKEFKTKPIENIYWGPEVADKEIEVALKHSNARKKYIVEKIKNIETVVAKLLSKGNVVARINGKMEFGARALGNRSILADPRNFDTVRVINESVKNRDFWMPFAPSILEDKHKLYIKNPRNISSYYMMMTFDTTDKGRVALKAAMHPYDFTARPQFVNKDYNSSYYKLIKEFEKLTGVGAVLNTSFNLHGYPIVLGPKEALNAFENSGLKYLAINSYLITKK